ncbi:MAG: 3-dehydroquinate synthase [Myxococcaceae bacterium]|nr:3-dehydroquinate synthase [Myxococcaceae bacterium]
MSPGIRAPGGHRRCHDVWGPFETCAKALPSNALCVADERVLKLHPKIRRVLKGTPIVAVPAGEKTKSLSMLTKLAKQVPASTRALLVIGGGTVGDLGTVLAHLIRRGVPLIHVPTTLLAAVDSSVGGKGAVHVGWLKNAWGVFHYADSAWLCPELWQTLTPDQHRQGHIEAFKMAVCFDARALERWRHGPPNELVKRARAQKERICAQDPYDSGGVRRVLNFGHTFGHAFESVTKFRLAHGDAVALGMLHALALGDAPPGLTREVEDVLKRLGAPPRSRLAALLKRPGLTQALAGDKKGASTTGANMVLLDGPGRAHVRWVELTARPRRRA